MTIGKIQAALSNEQPGPSVGDPVWFIGMPIGKVVEIEKGLDQQILTIELGIKDYDISHYVNMVARSFHGLVKEGAPVKLGMKDNKLVLGTIPFTPEGVHVPEGRYKKDENNMWLSWKVKYSCYNSVTINIFVEKTILGELWLDGDSDNPAWNQCFLSPADVIKWAYCAAECFGGPHMNTTDEAWLKEQWQLINKKSD